MTLWKQRLLARYCAPANGDGAEGGGGAGDGGGDGGEGGEGGSGDGDGEGSGAGDGDGKDGEGDGEGEGKPAKKPVAKPKPTDAEARLLKENMKKKDDLKKANDALAKANERLAEFDGLDAAELKKLLADKRTAEEKQLSAAGEWQQLKTRMAEEHGKAIKVKDTALETAVNENRALKTQIEELTVGRAFGDSKFLVEDTVFTPAKARKLWGEHFDVVDGVVTGFDKPRGAQGRTVLADQYGIAVAFEEALKALVESDPDKDSILKSKVKSGAGSSSNGKPAKRQDGKATTSLDKINAGMKSLISGK